MSRFAAPEFLSDCTRTRIATAAARISRAPDERHHSQQAASLRQQVQRDGRAERQEDWKRQQHHARSGLSDEAVAESDPIMSMSSEPADWCTR